jgi:hypothetical protein
MMNAYEQEELDQDTLYHMESMDSRLVAAEDSERSSELQETSKQPAKKYQTPKKLKKSKYRMQSRPNITRAQRLAPEERTAQPKSATQREQAVAESSTDSYSSEAVTSKSLQKRSKKTSQAKTKIQTKERTKISQQPRKHFSKQPTSKKTVQQRQKYTERKRATVKTHTDSSVSSTQPYTTPAEE